MDLVKRWILPLALALAVAVPSSAWAQGRGNARGHDKNKNKHEQVRVVDRDDDNRVDRNRRRDRDDGDDRVVVVRDRDRRDQDRHPWTWFDQDRDRWTWERRDRDRDRRTGRDRFILRDRNRSIVIYDDDLFWYPVRTFSGPSFCRSGAGHPVWGLQWCLDKGYAIGRPGTWFLRGDDLFLVDGSRIIVLRDRAYDADRAFWSTVVGQLLALVD